MRRDTASNEWDSIARLARSRAYGKIRRVYASNVRKAAFTLLRGAPSGCDLGAQ